LILKKIDLFTNEENIIKIIASEYSINKIFTENKYIFKIAEKLKINLTLVKSHQDLYKINSSISNLGISYGFGIIFKNKFIKKYKEGIWNIHSGDLPAYRGRHPITAAFLNNEKKIGLSIHLINEKIDQGFLLAKCFVKRTYQDDELSIKKKLLKNLSRLLKKARRNLQKKNITKILKGKYFKPFYSGIEIKESKNVNYIYIYNAAKAQKYFGGILVNGIRYYDAIFYAKKKINYSNKIIICKNYKKLILIKKKQKK
tara:strand:+ start:463 stop:1233 length:771 start_codon:yes stop_codon:yes gene_type:complete